MNTYNSIFLKLDRGPEFRREDQIISATPITIEGNNHFKAWAEACVLIRLLGLANVNSNLYDQAGRKVGRIQPSRYQKGNN